MSEVISMRKDVVAEFEVVIYDVYCECGEELTFTTIADKDGDIRIQVEPHVCIQEEA